MADNRPNAEIVLCKCGTTKKMFGIRVEETAKKQWALTWAFPISENRAKREKYGSSVIDGSFYMTEEFPGCPHCGNTAFFRCSGCGKLTCYDGEATRVTCSHCGRQANIGGTISSMDTGGDL